MTSTEETDLEASIRPRFPHISLSALIERINRASDYGCDDEEVELRHRLRPKGLNWRWSRDGNERVLIYSAATTEVVEPTSGVARSRTPVPPTTGRGAVTGMTRPTMPPARETAEIFYRAVARLGELTDAELAREFAQARLGDVINVHPTAAPGLFEAQCERGRAYIALIGTADLEGFGLEAAVASELVETLVVAVTGEFGALSRQYVVTPRESREMVREAYIGHEGISRRYRAWSVHSEWATLALASRPFRNILAATLRQSERQVYEAALDLARQHSPAFVAEPLPYPPSAYEPALARAVAGEPEWLQSYAQEVVRATLAGERHWYGDREHDGPPAPESTSRWRAEHVRRRIDKAVQSVRYAHLPPGTRVQVMCDGDEEIRPAVVGGLVFGASSPLLLRVRYPKGYRSPQESGLLEREGQPAAVEVINPSFYSLAQIVAPPNPLHALAAAAADVELEPRRRFTAYGQ